MDSSRPAAADINSLLAPRRIAVIGASEDQGKFGGRVLQMLLRHHFPGSIYPINPNRSHILGLTAYPSVDETPEAADLAIMAVPQPQVKAHIERCAARGVKGAIIITGSFSDAGPEGAALEREIVAVARAAGMRLMGPNCLGVISPASQLVLCSSPALDVDTLPRGEVGFVSQSGAFMGTVFDRAGPAGVGFSHCVSVGNQADLELCDFIEFLIEDAGTRVICAYVEGLKSPSRFVALAHRARHAGKPLLVVKAGRTQAGSAAAFSHTASLAGDFAAMEAVCRRENVVLLNDVFSMLILAGAMARRPGHKVRGVVMLSVSGGSAAIAADALSDAGVPLATFGPATKASLDEVFVRGQADNPVDLFGPKVNPVPDFAYQGARRAMADPAADLCLSIITTAPGLSRLCRDIATGCDEAGKPVIHVMQPAKLGDAPRAELMKTGHPYADALGEAVEAVRAWIAWSAFVEPVDEPLPAVDFDPPAAGCVLGEAEAKRLLARAGLQVNEGRVVPGIDEACQATAAIGFPLVAKLVSPQVVHKSDVGGVALNLRTVDELRAALDRMVDRVRRERPDAVVEGFFIQRMAGGSIEVLVGARRDPQFGPMVVVGSGGVLVELLKDVRVLPAPVTPTAARQALASLKIAPLLAGYRGSAPADVEGVVDAIVRLGVIAQRAHAAGLEFEIEVNPMKVDAAGCVVVDARAMFKETTK